MKCYLFDIDGTIADLSHRLHHVAADLADNGATKPKDWDAFYAACGDDKPIPHMVELLLTLFRAGSGVVYVSGRSDQCRNDTVNWIMRHNLPVGPLYMRKCGDHRPDHLVKAALLDQILADGYKPALVFDDRNQVVKMWRERGIPCCQVAEGNY